MLIDNHGRKIDYLRLAVTDRCNLRCLYCMPAEGLHWLPRKEILSLEEIERLLYLFSQWGITKVRFTGGEPFMRKDFPLLLQSIASKKWFETLSITTNGTLLEPHIPLIQKLGLHTVNLSIDTLDASRFYQMTRRDDFAVVWNSFEQLINHGIRTKVNAIVMKDRNEEDIVPLVELTRQFPVDVRFIEEMPFNGSGNYTSIHWTAQRIIEEIRKHYPGLEKVNDEPNDTVSGYQVPGHQGQVGVIAAYSRSFCGTCNRLRLNAEGKIKTCLYEVGHLSLRDAMRAGASDKELEQLIRTVIGQRFANGFEAEKHRMKNATQESMARIGG